jgi:hypothetical protein
MNWSGFGSRISTTAFDTYLGRLGLDAISPVANPHVQPTEIIPEAKLSFSSTVLTKSQRCGECSALCTAFARRRSSRCRAPNLTAQFIPDPDQDAAARSATGTTLSLRFLASRDFGLKFTISGRGIEGAIEPA